MVDKIEIEKKTPGSAEHKILAIATLKEKRKELEIVYAKSKSDLLDQLQQVDSELASLQPTWNDVVCKLIFFLLFSLVSGKESP